MICAAVLMLSLSLACAENLPGPDPDKKVDSIEVYQMPDQTVYVVGDTFSAEGGILKINYKDGTAGYIAMTDEAVSLKSPTMNTVNTKNVQVRYESAKAVFKVEVVAGMCEVTFHWNYEGAPEDEKAEVSKGARVEAVDVISRDGWDFANWYADADFTRPFDFDAPVTGDTDVYALWLKQGAEYVTVTFDYDYYGVIRDHYDVPVEKETPVSQPGTVPEREGYTFVAWAGESGENYDFSAPVSADTVIRAVWQRNVPGAQTWVFEAEDTVLTGKIGPSFSGSAQEESMIIYNDQISASGDRVVGYLYESGITLEFWIAADQDVTDAQIAVRVTGEYVTMSYDGNDYQVLVNGAPKNYPRVTMEIASQSDVPPCEDWIVLEGVSLKKGENLIQLKTNNTNDVAGTTFKANAPLVDCLKITADAVLIWDENHGEPATANYKK
ncbi:MAG: InlB B-repeat-containing protein [Clostridia bacterium]|nr:InlB B-repeat-containing protein [Clostridia bacterium]